MRKIEREHAAPQDRFTAFGMADACKFKFVNYLADIFRAGHSRTNASTRVRDTLHVGRRRRGSQAQSSARLLPHDRHERRHQLDRPPPLEGPTPSRWLTAGAFF